MKKVIYAQKIQIDGKDYTFEEAKQIYEELREIFDAPLPPPTIPWKPVEPGTGYPHVVARYGCLPPDIHTTCTQKSEEEQR